jgi:hypothetical protein
MKVIVATVGLSLLAAAAYAQAPRERTIEEIKIEAQARAERGGYAPRKALAFARWQLAQWKKCNSDGSSPVIGRPQGWRCAPPPPAAAALTPPLTGLLALQALGRGRSALCPMIAKPIDRAPDLERKLRRSDLDEVDGRKRTERQRSKRSAHIEHAEVDRKMVGPFDHLANPGLRLGIVA